MTDRLADLQDLAGAVSRETFDRLCAFEPVFLKWARSMNLVAASTLEDVWRRHILDSAQLMRLAPNCLHWLDLGSGAGFPGLVTAFLLADRPGAHVDLVESNSKKTGFLNAMVGQFALPAKVHTARIEDVAARFASTEVVTARALAPRPLLIELASPWLSKGAPALFHKGRDYRSELGQTANQWAFELVEYKSKIDPHGVILDIRNLRRRSELAREP